MNQMADSGSGEEFTGADTTALELRIFRSMIASVAITVLAGAMLAPWRVSAGLMLGGMLSLLNYHWLRTSIAAVLNGESGRRPRVKISRYIVRYMVIGAAVFAAYKLQMVSLPATIVGLCSFVPALLVEAFRQFYFAIIHREETH
jgi:ATP synthase I subunit